MFRPNLLFNKSRLIPLSYRSFCNLSQPEKCYIIKTKDEGKKVVYESQIMKRFRDQQKEVAKVQISWDQMIQIFRELMSRGQQEAVIIIQKFKIEEKLLMMKKSQTEKLQSKIAILKGKFEPEKLKEIPERVKYQFGLLQTSDGYKKLLSTPKTVFLFSKSSYVNVRHCWGIFLQSEAKKKLEQIIMWMWINGKFITLRFIRFIREAYFDKSGVKALPKPK